MLAGDKNCYLWNVKQMNISSPQMFGELKLAFCVDVFDRGNGEGKKKIQDKFTVHDSYFL